MSEKRTWRQILYYVISGPAWFWVTVWMRLLMPDHFRNMKRAFDLVNDLSEEARHGG